MSYSNQLNLNTTTYTHVPKTGI